MKISFYDTAGAGVDPDLLKFRVLDPEGNETEYIYEDDAELVRDAQGQFHIDVPLATERKEAKFCCRWEAYDASDIPLAAAECILETISDYRENP